MPYHAHYLYFLVALYPLAVLINKSLQTKKQKRTDEVIRAIQNTGKVVHKNRVYEVREICNISRDSARGGKPEKYLIVTRAGEERLFKLPLDSVEPYADVR